MIQHHRFTDIDPKIEAKVNDLLAKMTLAEKAWQMTQLGPNAMNVDQLEEEVRQGAGSILNYYDSAGVNRLQKIAMEESRLKIPLILGNDVIHGYRTIFPIPLACSCSWNLDLVQEAARIAAEEARANGTHWTFTPMVDIARIVALEGQINASNTFDRLTIESSGKVLSSSGRRDLLDAYEFIATTRLQHQVKQIRRGEQPDNYMKPEELSHFERNHLRDAFSVIKTIQSALANAHPIS